MTLNKNKNFIITHLIAVVILVFLFWDNKHGRNSNSTKSLADMTFIKGTVANSLKRDVAEQGSPYVLLSLHEFPKFKFDITEIKYMALNARDLVNDVQVNDTLTLGILTYDYDTKIKEKKPLGLSERFINYSLIEPYEIRSQNKAYMTVDSVNTALQNDHS